MSHSWPYPGSRWWAFDFHTHTPASHDTPWYLQNLTLTPDDWLLSYMAAGIDCVAVTDHNSGAWIDQLKAAYAQMKAQAATDSPPQGFRELHLFPGVELSVQGGFHLLAILTPEAGSSDIDTLLGKIDYDGTKGDCDGVTRKGAAEVVEAVIAAGGIAVPAHADEDNGLLQVEPGTRKCRLDANSVSQVVASGCVLAMEWRDSDALIPAVFDKPTSNWARVLGSDCHSFRGTTIPGSRYTWVKMATPTLEGLRLALLDGNGVSIRRSDEGGFEPYQTPEHFITRIDIENARCMGRGKTQTLELTPFCNALIGGRGTGKSTIVHALRLAYRREEEIKRLHDEAEPRKQWERFRLVAKGRDGKGALQENTELRVELMRDGVAHRLRWRADGQGTVVEFQDKDHCWQVSPSQTVNAERFPIRLFSQDQITTMAGDNRQALLDVVDEAAGVANLRRKFDESQRTYLAQCARLRELEGKLAGRAEAERELADLAGKLDAFEQSHHADVLKAHQRAARQQREVATTLEQAGRFPAQIDAVAQTLLLDDWLDGVFDASLHAGILAWRAALETRLQQTRDALTQLADALTHEMRTLETDPRLVCWRASTHQAHSDYEALKNTLALQGVADPQAYGRLVQKRQEAERQIKQFDQLQQDCDSLRNAIAAQWQQVFAVRTQISDTRKEFLAAQLQDNPFVRMELVPFGYDARVIERSLRKLLDVMDERFDADILEFKDGNPAGGLAYALAQADDRTTAATLVAVKNRLIDADAAFGGRFRNYLQRKLEKPEFADHVQCWFPDDDLRIEYSRNGDGKAFTSIEQGSPGQRAAALLAFLLAFGDEPLVLDQPEDDLDNHLIYELIVRQIRENKRRRQLIIVTHNPNLVVNGDAEMVHTFAFGRGQCHVPVQGALQDKAVREEVCQVMEGGHEAFARRWARLGREV